MPQLYCFIKTSGIEILWNENAAKKMRNFYDITLYERVKSIMWRVVSTMRLRVENDESAPLKIENQR